MVLALDITDVVRPPTFPLFFPSGSFHWLGLVVNGVAVPLVFGFGPEL